MPSGNLTHVETERPRKQAALIPVEAPKPLPWARCVADNSTACGACHPTTAYRRVLVCSDAGARETIPLALRVRCRLINTDTTRCQS